VVTVGDMSTNNVQIPTDASSLTSGAAMPLLGFGTWQLRGDVASEATATALDAGYRHLDTAAMYRNETEVGKALDSSGVDRDDVFVTTKFNPRSGDAELDVLRRSLDQLGTDHVDLWLVHAPADDARNRSVWQNYVSAQQDGLARDIGVSNFSLDQVDAVTDASGVRPAVNQIEWRPTMHDRSVLEGHRTRGVLLEGYSGLRGGILHHPVVGRVADEVGRTPAQVLVRWHLQHGIAVIPRSSQPDHIRDNADVAGFTLDDDQMAVLDALGG
jgi:2,5-diketo-D-gluconate reductase A